METIRKKMIKRSSAAKYLGISTTLMERLEAEKQIKHILIPSKGKKVVLYKTAWLDDFKQQNTINVKS